MFFRCRREVSRRPLLKEWAEDENGNELPADEQPERPLLDPLAQINFEGWHLGRDFVAPSEEDITQRLATFRESVKRQGEESVTKRRRRHKPH